MNEVVPTKHYIQPVGPILWQNVSYGMSLEDVRHVQPNVIESNESHILGDGSKCSLVIPNYEIILKKAEVLFYFNNQQIKQITIKMVDRPSLTDFQSLTVVLRAKYGQEIEMHISHDSFSTAEWIANTGANISMICFPEIGCLNVNFQARLAQEASKL